MSVAIPSWVPVAARILAAVVGVIIGVKMWADGYSAVVLALSSTILVAELGGLGLTTSQAQAVTNDLVDLVQNPSKVEEIANRYGIFRPPPKST